MLRLDDTLVLLKVPFALDGENLNDPNSANTDKFWAVAPVKRVGTVDQLNKEEQKTERQVENRKNTFLSSCRPQSVDD